MLMTFEEAKQALKKYGWNPRIRVLKSHRRKYLYAYQWYNGKQREKYVWPMEKLDALTEADIVARLRISGATTERGNHL